MALIVSNVFKICINRYFYTINSVKMNATFSLTLVIFVTFIVPIPMGITVVSVPITTVLPLTLSPFTRYYRYFRPHYRGFTVVTVDLLLSPSPCSSLVYSEQNRLPSLLCD